jgi:hypothetical protein
VSRLGGDVTPFVPALVAQWLEEKFSKERSRSLASE